MSSIGPELPPHLLKQTSEADVEEDDPQSSIGPALPPHLSNLPLVTDQADEDEEEDEDAYVPELPPGLSVSRTAPQPPSTASPPLPASTSSKRILGPSLPTQNRYGDDEDDDYGPMPMPEGHRQDAGDGVREFMEKEEKRRKEVEEAAKPKALKRDEWMLVPPSSSDILGKLADPTKLKARQFSRSAAPASRNAPNNLWTETPAERQQRIADEVAGKKRRAANADADAVEEDGQDSGEGVRKRRRDEEIRRVVEDHTKSSRSKTLLDMHSSASSSSSNKPGGSNDDDKAKVSAIWDHSRDMSMGGRLMDDKQRSKLINDAKALGERFGSGKAGGYL
ncbi:hypothetical protein BD410DRAFT_898265 [Rickenella mellea]|uniref:DUF3752 domain-containing protein n=1 Tax=Rickenella mellea TaxID=50990 RepID=A0A4Y7Q665_9AGAM|nr:hypothetical protein BD410DRAFT_898265 [Rickenella mellea]